MRRTARTRIEPAPPTKSSTVSPDADVHRLVSDPDADLDIESAFEWYEGQHPGLGADFIDQLRRAYDRISAGPHRYPEPSPPFRRALLRRFPYGVYFVVEPGQVVLVAVLHLARDPEVLRGRSGSRG